LYNHYNIISPQRTCIQATIYKLNLLVLIKFKLKLNFLQGNLPILIMNLKGEDGALNKKVLVFQEENFRGNLFKKLCFHASVHPTPKIGL